MKFWGDQLTLPKTGYNPHARLHQHMFAHVLIIPFTILPDFLKQTFMNPCRLGTHEIVSQYTEYFLKLAQAIKTASKHVLIKECTFMKT